MTDHPISADGLTFIDNPQAPTVFADEAIGFFALQGNIRTTFTIAAVEHSKLPGPVNRVVIGRLVMSEQAAESFAKGLLGFIENRRREASSPDQGNTSIN